MACGWRTRWVRVICVSLPGQCDPNTRKVDVMPDDLAAAELPHDTVGLLEGLTTTRAIRRYRDEPVPPEALRAILFAGTRAPSGSNRQPFRFLVLTDGPNARAAKLLIGNGARRAWGAKRQADRYDIGSGNGS